MLAEEEKTPLRCSIYDNLPALDAWYCPSSKNKEEEKKEDRLQKLINKSRKNVSFCNDPPPITYYNALDDDTSSFLNEKQLDYAPSGCCGGLISGKSLICMIYACLLLIHSYSKIISI